MKCPAENCSNVLAVHSRRLYCASCRAAMAYHAKKRPAEILEYSLNLKKRVYRVEHITERTLDQNEALSQKRRASRETRKPIRSNGARTRI